jgi:hypothetical protein
VINGSVIGNHLATARLIWMPTTLEFKFNRKEPRTIGPRLFCDFVELEPLEWVVDSLNAAGTNVLSCIFAALPFVIFCRQH